MRHCRRGTRVRVVVLECGRVRRGRANLSSATLCASDHRLAHHARAHRRPSGRVFRLPCWWSSHIVSRGGTRLARAMGVHEGVHGQTRSPATALGAAFVLQSVVRRRRRRDSHSESLADGCFPQRGSRVLHRTPPPSCLSCSCSRAPFGVCRHAVGDLRGSREMGVVRMRVQRGARGLRDRRSCK